MASMKRRSFLGVTLPLLAAGKSVGASLDPPELVFGVIADPQYADLPPKGSRFYRNSIGKLKAAIEHLNREPLEFVVTLGDLIDTDYKSFEPVMPLYEPLRVPHHPICGNHDFDVADDEKERVLAAMRLDESYYSRVHKSWRFIFLDGTELGVWRHAAADPRTKTAKALLKKLEAEGKPQAKPYNSGMGPEQMAWLKVELEAAKKAEQRVILFNHYPVIPAGNSHNLWNAEELVDLIDENDHVAAYMNGHNHAGNYGTHRHCHYINFKGMVETETQTAYGVVRCFDDRLEIVGSGIELNRDLGKL
jgi:3',5'-cyclic AMP phosphodiesterase CpdA